MRRLVLLILALGLASAFSGYVPSEGRGDSPPVFPGGTEEEGGEGSAGGPGPPDPPEEEEGGEDDGGSDGDLPPGETSPGGGNQAPIATNPGLPMPPSPVIQTPVWVVLTAEGADGNPTTAPSVGFTLACTGGSGETVYGTGEFVLGNCPTGSPVMVCSHVPDNWEPLDNCHRGYAGEKPFDFHLRRIPDHAGYCHRVNGVWKFELLEKDQQINDPYWASQGPWRDAYRDPVTGAISCDFPAQPTTPVTNTSQPSVSPRPVTAKQAVPAKAKSKAKAKPTAPAVRVPVLTAPDPLSGQPHYRGACYIRADGVLAFKGTDPGPGEGPALYTDITGDGTPDSHCELNRLLNKAVRAAYINRYFPKK